MQAAPEAVFTVNSNADVNDTSVGNGVCETAASGICTLRAAVQEASADPNADTINLPAGSYQLFGPEAPEDAGLHRPVRRAAYPRPARRVRPSAVSASAATWARMSGRTW